MVNTKGRLIIFFAAEDGEALYSQQNKNGSWLWKTIRPFRYDLNQIPYDYAVEVTFNGLDLIDRVPEELGTEVFDIT